MKRRAVILSMVLSASLVLTGCSWSEIKSKFTGEDSSTTSTASQDDDYVASECVSIPEYKGIEVDCSVSDDEVQSQLDSFVSQNSTEKKIKKGKCKKGDTVKVIAGKDKDKEGKVIAVNKKNNTLLVEGINMVTKHAKPSMANQQGGIIHQEGPIDAANVMFLHKGKATRVGFKMDGDKKVRNAKSTGDVID